MNAGEKSVADAPPGPSAAPGPGLLAASVAALFLPMLLAALFPHMPDPAREYLLKLSLPLLVIECALLFALLGLPLFPAPAPGRVNPGLVGLVRGAFLGLVAVPFVLVARVVSPAPLGAALVGCLLVGVTGAGAGAAAAAFRARGLTAAAVLAVLPGLLGFLAMDVFPPLARMIGLSPFYAAHLALASAGGWWAGFLPGAALLAVGFAVRGRSRSD